MGLFFEESMNGGWGFIIRDNLGGVICAGAGQIPHLKDAIQTEAEACIQAINAAIELGMGKILVQSWFN